MTPARATTENLADPVAQYLPSSDNAQWTYAWSDSKYAQQSTLERYSLTQRDGAAFRIQWTTDGLGNPDAAIPGAGYMDFERTDAGLVNLTFRATPAPANIPILCAQAINCANTLAGTYDMVIWGSRTPVLAEPLVEGSSWTSAGGADGDVTSTSTYAGTTRVFVPAYGKNVTAARVETQITQAGALGDPYGSGIRTVWWVRGVGPVRVEIRHTGGAVQQAQLVQTNLIPRQAPSDFNYLPFVAGRGHTYRWRNSKHLRAWSTQRVTVAKVASNSAQVDVKSVRGPIGVRGVYTFSSRLDGVTNLSGSTRAATRAKFPRLAHNRHFFTPLDFMAYGFNPVITAYPAKGDRWASHPKSRDYSVFGVKGASRILGAQEVRVPAGRFRALVVRSTLTQKGHPYGSGTRTSYFAPGRGLVKLVFRHRDGSVSTVEQTQ